MARHLYSIISALLLIAGLIFLIDHNTITGLVIQEQDNSYKNEALGGVFIASSILVSYLGTRKSKKGQAAMEFLMTYGWAILAAILVLGTLASIGIFSADSFSQNTVILSPPFYANAWQITENNIQLEIKNNAGSSYTLNSVVIEGCGTEEINSNLAPGEMYVVDLDCNTPLDGGRFTGDIEIYYTKSGSNLEVVSSGSASATISESEEPPAEPECSDSLDNDEDNAIDDADYACAQGGPNEDSFLAECQDGIDNDGDGLIDWSVDLGCAGAANDNSENSESVAD